VAGLAETPGATYGAHPSVNTEHPWGMRWPTSTVTRKPITPAAHKPMTATQQRELAELELNYARAQRREMELSLKGIKQGVARFIER
jgi:hypothetical protein